MKNDFWDWVWLGQIRMIDVSRRQQGYVIGKLAYILAKIKKVIKRSEVRYLRIRTN